MFYAANVEVGTVVLCVEKPGMELLRFSSLPTGTLIKSTPPFTSSYGREGKVKE